MANGIPRSARIGIGIGCFIFFSSFFQPPSSIWVSTTQDNIGSNGSLP